MTFDNIFASAMAPTAPNHYGQHPKMEDSHRVLSERDGSIYGYGYPKESKGTFKADKKRAAMSALTLLAFLFFLNILQNCLREQTQPIASEVTMMMMMRPSDQQKQMQDSQTHLSFSAQDREKETKGDENLWESNVRRSRSLLQFDEERSQTAVTSRHTKFISDFAGVRDGWANGLSQLSEKDRETHRMKTENFRSFLEKYRPGMESLPKESPTTQLPLQVGYGRPKVMNEMMTSKHNATDAEALPTSSYENIMTFAPKPYIRKYSTRKHLNNGGKSKIMAYNDWVPSLGPMYNQTETSVNVTTGSGKRDRIWIKHDRFRTVGQAKFQSEDVDGRNRRSDATNGEEKSSAEDTNKIQDEIYTVTPSPGPDWNSYKIYPVYSYHNHRHVSEPQEGNRKGEITTATPALATKDHGTGGIVSTTEFAPAKPRNPIRKHQLMTNRFRYANPNRYLKPNHSRHPTETRFRYSPFRKNYHESNPAGYHVHEEFYPVAVIGKHPQEDEVGFDLIKFVWTMLSGFAKPLSRIMPSFAKIGNDEPQCYDLLVCEAHRVGRIMGPTAEALASTFSTLLTWYTSEENRQALMEAISSGKENTCQKQIVDCDERSGGKSAMTVIAQVLEMKLR